MRTFLIRGCLLLAFLIPSILLVLKYDIHMAELASYEKFHKGDLLITADGNQETFSYSDPHQYVEAVHKARNAQISRSSLFLNGINIKPGAITSVKIKFNTHSKTNNNIDLDESWADKVGTCYCDQRAKLSYVARFRAGLQGLSQLVGSKG